MKKVFNISLANRSFTLEEDAYNRLSEYLEHFRTRLAASSGVPYTQNAEVMEDLESRIAGVCAGLAIYLDIDVVLTRVLMLVALVAGLAGFWIYVICWIAIPKALTATQKCEMYGLPVTAENLARFAQSQNK